MRTHSMLPESGTPKACAIEGRALFGMDESSVVMNAADPDSASTTHLFACSSRSTSVAVATSSCAVREACCPWSEDETARSLWAEGSEELGAPGGSPAAFASGWVPEWSKDYPSLRCTMYRGALLVPVLARCGPTPMWVASPREAAPPLQKFGQKAPVFSWGMNSPLRLPVSLAGARIPLKHLANSIVLARSAVKRSPRSRHERTIGQR